MLLLFVVDVAVVVVFVVVVFCVYDDVEVVAVVGYCCGSCC